MSKQLPLPFPPEVEWRDVPGYEGYYQVSNTGLIRSRNKKPCFEVLKSLSGGRYLRIFLCKEGKTSQRSIHSLVMLAFVGERPVGMEINHKNGVRHDNRLGNLEYCTRQENMLHTHRVLGSPNRARGERIQQSKLTEGNVIEIRKLYTRGMTSNVLAEMFKVCVSNIRCIIRRDTWGHVE